jgi:hypothetical protein
LLRKWVYAAVQFHVLISCDQGNLHLVLTRYLDRSVILPNAIVTVAKLFQGSGYFLVASKDVNSVFRDYKRCVLGGLDSKGRSAVGDKGSVNTILLGILHDLINFV